MIFVAVLAAGAKLGEPVGTQLLGGRYSLTERVWSAPGTRPPPVRIEPLGDESVSLSVRGDFSLDSPTCVMPPYEEPATLREGVTEEDPDSLTACEFRDRQKYRRSQRAGRGSFGEVWRGESLRPESSRGFRHVVLKRLVSGSPAAELSGLREVYCGELLSDVPNVATFIEAFEEDSGSGDGSPNRWLVFADEGRSIRQWMFQAEGGLETPSQFWWDVKASVVGERIFREVIRGVLSGLAVAHDRETVHRDIKLSNVLVAVKGPVFAKICDWGSAVPFVKETESPLIPTSNGHYDRKTDEREKDFWDFGGHFEPFSMLYPPEGPTRDEETEAYQPPEARWARSRQDRLWRKPSYDMWSLGMVFLELVLGREEPLLLLNRRKLSQLQAYLRKHLDEDEEEVIMFLALDEMCLCDPPPPLVLETPDAVARRATPSPDGALPVGATEVSIPAPFESRGSTYAPFSPSKWRTRCKNFAADVDPTGSSKVCDDEEFARQIRLRDPANAGLASLEARDLLRRLLNVEPRDRPSTQEALSHAWFFGMV